MEPVLPTMCPYGIRAYPPSPALRGLPRPSPLDQGFLKLSLMWSSSIMVSRSLASGGRRMYLHRASRACWSLATTWSRREE